ncbi:MAG: phosphoribosylformylglycinamidine synthase subunit PurL [Actinomycetota bacterium]|nr:phosphoribosylformylglycinamidine synthase subunit PurL [Actinomycetota bacterium]
MTDPVAADPVADQPYSELGLEEEEYLRIRALLGRRPTATELAMYSVMWSEHCSYKSSRVHLRRLAATARAGAPLLAGMGDNAGVVDIGGGLAVTFKVESHNHPSFVEPYQGAATGVGGIVRDILAMGARPVAIMDSLRFGLADAPDTARVLPGVVAGVAGYGNCLGLPNIGGEVGFDPSYAGNPLVNALCLGVLRHEQLQRAAATGEGNAVVLLGAKTGRDGIGGVSVLASATFSAEDDGGSGAGRAQLPSVQVGDPFTEKVVVECCLELFARDLVVGVQDLGGAGLTCALSETSAAGRVGMRVALERVPLREASMAPHEVLVSESQERMLAVVRPAAVAEVLDVCNRWGVPATVVGEVTATGRLIVTWHGKTVCDVPPASLADEGPVYERPLSRPADQDRLVADEPTAQRLPRPRTGAQLRATLLRMLASPELCARSWVTDQYDRYVRGNTALAQPEDAGVVRLDEDSGLGVALALDGNGRFARLDPYAGTQLALAEAWRNVATTGGRPLAVTDCLNFGSPEDPAVMWQFAEAVRGLGDGCAELGVPVTGGNVSFYNSTGATAINPTPVVGVLGVLDDVARRTPMGFAIEGETLLLLGATREEFGGSAWAQVEHGHLGGRPPQVDLAAERRLAEVLVGGSRDGLLSAAHDLSEGGLVQALVESCLRGGCGARVALPAELDPFVTLFAESAARVVVAVAPSAELRVTEMCRAHRVPVVRLGVVGGDALDVEGLLRVPLTELRAAYEGTFPRLFG